MYRHNRPQSARIYDVAILQNECVCELQRVGSGKPYNSDLYAYNVERYKLGA